MQLRHLRRKLLWSVLFGLLVFVALALYGDLQAVAVHVRNLEWRLLPLALALTLVNYGLRFVKWEYYLRVIQAPLPWRRSLLVFLATFPMVLTPGKIGEFLKAYFVKRSNGAPMARAAPIILAERITDGLAMFVLAGVGLFFFSSQGPLMWTLIAVAAAMLGFVLLTRWPRLVAWGLQQWARLPLVGRLHPQLRSAYTSTYEIFALRRLLFAVGLGVISWGSECVALYVTLLALGVAPGAEVLLVSVFTLAVATLIGAVSFLPGGLGAADASIAALLEALIHLPAGLSVAATLIIRFFTLWFGVLIGLVALAMLLRRLDIAADTTIELADASPPAPGRGQPQTSDL